MDLLFIVAVAISLLGAVLLWIGLRGRQIDEHPVCRKCKFDLEGVYPAKETCPECGRDLSRGRAVRTGNRRKRRAVLAAGGGLLTVSLVVAALMVTVLIGGSTLNPYKPVWMLRLEAQGSDVTAAGDAIDELMERYDDDKLSEAQVDGLVALALDRHAVVDGSNEQEWIEAIETLQVDGELSKEEFSRYLAQALVYVVDVRDPAHVAAPIPIRIVASDARWGSSRRMLVQIAIAEAGRPVPEETTPFVVQGQRPAGRSTATLTHLIDERTTPGRHEIPVTVHLRVRDFTGYQRQPDSPVRAAIDRRFDLETHVVEGGVVEAVSPTDQLRDAMRAAVTIRRAQNVGVLQIEISREDAPMDGISKIILRIDGEEHPVRDSPAIRVDRTRGVTNVSSFTMASAGHLVKDVERVDIILRPDPDAAERTTDLQEIYGEDLIFEDVPIERPGG